LNTSKKHFVYIIPINPGRNKDSSGQSVMIIKKTSMVTSQGYTALVNSVITNFEIPEAT
jgi:hypothetical protein